MKRIKLLHKIPIYLFMVMMSVCALLPFYMMIVMGTHYSEDLYTGVKLFFGKYFVQNFQTVMRQNFLLYYWKRLTVPFVATYWILPIQYGPTDPYL